MMGDGYFLVLLLSYIVVLIAVIEHSPNAELNQKPILPPHSRGRNGIHHGQTICCTFFVHLLRFGVFFEPVFHAD